MEGWVFFLDLLDILRLWRILGFWDLLFWEDVFKAQLCLRRPNDVLVERPLSMLLLSKVPGRGNAGEQMPPFSPYKQIN
jgi:hypothetical protein